MDGLRHITTGVCVLRGPGVMHGVPLTGHGTGDPHGHGVRPGIGDIRHGPIILSGDMARDGDTAPVGVQDLHVRYIMAMRDPRDREPLVPALQIRDGRTVRVREETIMVELQWEDREADQWDVPPLERQTVTDIVIAVPKPLHCPVLKLIRA